ncbi:MAG: PQQ-like beta-propeller repeat protein, partial [Verrucomicrobia bacterium]|nr:PQQ-like beta-propeller repeat protein [Verrucomicrobiota bacterium]
WWPGVHGGQILAHLGTKLAGLAPAEGRKLWEMDDVAGGLWTASILSGGHAFVPTAGQVRTLESAADGVRDVWRSPVFEGVMGPVVEVKGLLVGHHERRLTALDAASGMQVWQQAE